MNIFRKNSFPNFFISFALVLILVITSVPQVNAASYRSSSRYYSAKFYITEKTDINFNSWNTRIMLAKYYKSVGKGTVANPSNCKGADVSGYITSEPVTESYIEENQYVEWNRLIKIGSTWYVLGNVITVEENTDIEDIEIDDSNAESGEDTDTGNSEEEESNTESNAESNNTQDGSSSDSDSENSSTNDGCNTESDSSSSTDVNNSTDSETSGTNSNTGSNNTDANDNTESNNNVSGSNNSEINSSANNSNNSSSSSQDDTSSDNSGFVYTKGTKFYDASGNEFIIKGMNFGNYMWYNPSTPQTWYNNEASYKELSEAGFNAIRYYLNYGLLEDDNNPYVYKETSLAWLDQNVAWAEKYGIKIIFNMHIPQGSKAIDSWDLHDGSLYLFTGSNAKANRDRLTAMWKFLANRYKNSTAVLGYGILNEPKVAYTGSIEGSKATWASYAQELTNAIRTVDNNHIIFVEPTTAIIDMSDKSEVIFDYTESILLVDDDNYAIEYHYYYPIEFTHQATNTSYAIGSSIYPNYNEVEATNAKWVTNIYYSSTYDYSAAGWQYIESPLYKVNSLSEMNAAYATLRAKELGSGSYAYFDNIVVTAYDANGNYVGELKNYDCNECDDYKVIGSLYNNNVYYDGTAGIDGSGCIVLKDATGEFTVTNSNSFKYFALQEGYSYKISAYVKVTGSTTSQKIVPTISFVKADSVTAFDKAYLKDKMTPFVNIMKENNVPLYIGEYGTFVATINYGGNQWVSDMLDIMDEQGLSASFHEYKPGLYSQYDSGTDWCVRNDELYNIFKSKLR